MWKPLGNNNFDQSYFASLRKTLCIPALWCDTCTYCACSVYMKHTNLSAIVCVRYLLIWLIIACSDLSIIYIYIHITKVHISTHLRCILDTINSSISIHYTRCHYVLLRFHCSVDPPFLLVPLYTLIVNYHM